MTEGAPLESFSASYFKKMTKANLPSSAPGEGGLYTAVDVPTALEATSLQKTGVDSDSLGPLN